MSLDLKQALMLYHLETRHFISTAHMQVNIKHCLYLNKSFFFYNAARESIVMHMHLNFAFK